MLYGSFFGKLLGDYEVNAGNWTAGWLTVAVGVAFFVSVTGLVLAIFLPYPNREEA